MSEPWKCGHNQPMVMCNICVEALESRNALLEKRCDDLQMKLEKAIMDNIGFMDDVAKDHAKHQTTEIARLEKENALLRKVREAAETVAFNVAGTVGTKTNSELPEWFRLRMADLVKALSTCEAGEK